MANKPNNNVPDNNVLGNNAAAEAFAVFSPSPARHPLAYDLYPLVHESNLLTPKYTRRMKYKKEREALLGAAARRAEARAKAAREAAIAAEAEAARIKEEYAARIRAMFNRGYVDRAISRMERGNGLPYNRLPFNNRSLAERVFAGPPPRSLPQARLPRPTGVAANGG